MNDISIEALTILASMVGGIGIVLAIGRVILHWNSTPLVSRYADGLNAAAALILVVYLGVQCHYLPLYYAIEFWSAGLGPPVHRADLDTFYRVEIATSLLFWVVLYLAKFSLLMLYRTLFAISRRFCAAWWGVFAFTVCAFFADFLGMLWLCGTPANLSNTAACSSRAVAIDTLKMIVMGTVVNVLSDFAIMVLALGMLPGLRVSFPKKLGLVAIFLLACVDIGFDFARLVVTFTEGSSTVFDTLEPALAVVICALPVYARTCKQASQWLRSRLSSISRGCASGGSKLPLQQSPRHVEANSPTSSSSYGAERFGTWFKSASTGKGDEESDISASDASMQKHRDESAAAIA